METSDTGMPGTNALAEDLAYQDAILQGVSRTFALTIPQLPQGLRAVVGNAYLLCRIADTIEDSDTLSVEEKRRYYDRFVEAVERKAPGAEFGRDLAPKLQGSTLDAERDLVLNTERVLRITHSFSDEDQKALRRCIRIMSEGMEDFQEGRFVNGLRDQQHLDDYCYHVAGVVGEMLTQLFCAHSPAIAAHKDQLEQRAVSFGEGLQMTNILKDIWDDNKRRVCWLPQGTFERAGFDLRDLENAPNDPAFQEGLGHLIAVARGHLENALDYTLLIPKSERGVRNFCLWAIGMAVLTLRKINRRRDFASGAEVKISRRSVRATVLFTKLFGGSNRLLRLGFRLAAVGLPEVRPLESESR
ncbi:MAG: phytoene/squalene synthase family protein [Candidatus Hydrogenedentota bacterium]